MTTIAKITGIWNEIVRDRAENIVKIEDFFYSLITSLEGLRSQLKVWYPKQTDENREWPTIFISYAWPTSDPNGANTVCLQNLLRFIEAIIEYLTGGSDNVFLDVSNMQGDFSEQQKTGIQNSDFIFLIGTENLRNRVIQHPSSNVAKEFLEIENKIQRYPDCEFLIPMMMDGDYKSAFPDSRSGKEISSTMIFDLRGLLGDKLTVNGLTSLVRNLLLYEPFGVVPRCFSIQGKRRKSYDSIVHVPIQSAIKFLTESQPVIPSSVFWTKNSADFIRAKSSEAKKGLTDSQVNWVLDKVSKGQVNEVRRLIKVNHDLLYATGQITDVRRRTYSDITLLQYSFMMGDISMCKAIIAEFRENEKRWISHQIDSQVIAQHGELFDLKTTLRAYEALEENWVRWDWDRRNYHWCMDIGKEQCNWPAWLRYEFAQEGIEAAWCKKTVCGEALERNDNWYGLNTNNDWYHGHDNKYKLAGGGLYKSGLWCVWIRGNRKRMWCWSGDVVGRFTLSSEHVNGVFDRECLYIEQLAITEYRRNLQDEFAALLLNDTKSDVYAPKM